MAEEFQSLAAAAAALLAEFNRLIPERQNRRHHFEKLSPNSLRKWAAAALEGDSQPPPALRWIYLLANYIAEAHRAADFKTAPPEVGNSLAVFYAGRLRKGLNLRPGSNHKYFGRISRGQQLKIAAAMSGGRPNEILPYRQFLQRLSGEAEFISRVKVLLNLLSDLEPRELRLGDIENIDFRWTALIIFALYIEQLLRRFSGSASQQQSPLEKYAYDNILSNPLIVDNIRSLEQAHR